MVIKKKFIYGIISVIVFLALFLLTFERENGPKSNKYSVVVFGDSIMAKVSEEVSLPELLEEKLGKAVFNGALGGTTLGRMDETKSIGYTKDCLSLAGLVRSIVTEDFGVQQTAFIRENATEYFEDTIDALDTIDFDKVDILLLNYGVNDYHAGTTIYPEEDSKDEYTFAGAIRSVITLLQERYPGLRIVLITPTYTWYEQENLTCEEYNLGGGILEEYVLAQIELAQELGVEVIDLYHDLYPHENWEDSELYTSDGVHPNEAGRELLAERIADFLY